MFSVRLVTADSYQATPLPQLDPAYSEFRGAGIKNVPIIRVFGTTRTGEKTCLHLHGVFPYMYVPFTGEHNVNIYPYKLAQSLDAAINVSLGSATSNTQHVYQIEHVAGIPYYGYHKREHQFFKVYFYNPAMMKKATDLLQNGAVLNTRLQPHEAHIPYILQFMIDYNVHGMSFIDLTKVQHRCVPQVHSKTERSDDSIISSRKEVNYIPSLIERQSLCEFEVDALVSDIQNRLELQKGIELNPGLAAIWNEERVRRAQAGLSSADSELINSASPTRSAYHSTESDIHQQQRLSRRLQLISQCDESTASTGTASIPYPLEVNDNDELINASNLGSFRKEKLDQSQQDLGELTDLSSLNMSQEPESTQSQHGSSSLNVEDVQLVEILMELARGSGDQDRIDDDSVLGTQSTMFDKEDDDGIEDEEDAVDLNITCSELNEMCSQEYIEESPGPLVPVNNLGVNAEEFQTSHGDMLSQNMGHDNQGIIKNPMPQLDGVGDLSHLLSFENDMKSDDKVFTVRELIPYPSKSCEHPREKLRDNDRLNTAVHDIEKISHRYPITRSCTEDPIPTNLSRRDIDVSIEKSIVNHELTTTLENESTFNQSMIPGLDGPADLSSSDSDPDAGPTEIDTEKRVCNYRLLKNKTEREAIITSRKREQLHSDENGDINDRRCVKRHTSHQTSETMKRTYSSTHRHSWRSPSISENYTPLKITVTSPRTLKITHDDSDERCRSPKTVTASVSMCTTPRRRTQVMHENLLRKRIKSHSSGEKDDVCNMVMNIEQRLMETYVKDKEEQSLAALTTNPCQSQDISPNVRNTTNVRKFLFFPTDNDSGGELSSQHNVAAKERRKSSEGANELCESEVMRSSSHHEIGNYSNEVTQISDPGMGEVGQVYPPTTSTDELDTDEHESCNVTFTQYLNAHKKKSQSLPCSIHSQIRQSQSRQSVLICPKFHPPIFKRVVDTLKMYNIPETTNPQPFFSNQADASGHKEMVHKILNVPGKSIINLPIFKSTMEDITGLNRWRRMKMNELHVDHQKAKSKSTRQCLAGKESIVIVPIKSAPTCKNVMKWLRVRDYLRTKRQKEINKGKFENQTEREGENMYYMSSTLNSDHHDSLDSSIISKSSSGLVGRIPDIGSEDGTTLRAEHTAQDIVSGTIASSKSSEAAESLQSMLAKSNLFKTVHSKKFETSSEQIDCLTRTARSNVINENMQNCRALPRHQFITIFCVEVHVSTRQDLLPNPQYDQISALFYAIQNDVPSHSAIRPLEHGVIRIRTDSDSDSDYCYGSKIPFVINSVADEKELFEKFVDIVNCSEAEILIGWEIESLSWGYIFQRATQLGINVIKDISRVPTSQWKWDNQPSNNVSSLADMKLPGRVVLDIWRIMKSEIALLTYTFENVMYYVMNERLPCPSFESLTKWWQSTISRWKVVQHYSTIVLGILRILDQLDVIGRTSEFARLFGIQFYEVFSRGSQYRVESLMLRLAKPFNFVAVSPSPQQRTSMRAMEALPLIMEPESMYYSDPVVVLDFQSLYPSIIIAHNYCFSTCLGRVEHIGQAEPFEFGASILRVPKHRALKLRGKVNYAPCGVAFVKREVRFGIVPRMLTEILNTRLMVKKAMKDHPQDDKLLQRVLHSRQKGLKDLANVTYGYTAANFTGRMPCVEVGDSIVSKGKETLERAIKLVESTPQWGARVIYGDTDSLFILIPGKSKSDAFVVGNEIADAVTASNPSPIKLKFEKILYPAILQTKKRYCGYMYETPEQKEPKFLAKGIETVRRDGCPAVSKILEKSLRILFDTRDVSLLKQYVTKQLTKVLRGKVSMDDLTFAKEFRGMKGYKERACVPALELTRRLMRKDPRAIPRRSQRVRYVIVAGAPNQALIHCVKSPWEVIDDPGLRLNGIYYVTRVIIPPLNRCLSLMGVDVNMWYKEMAHRQMVSNPTVVPDHKQKQTISQYFGTVVCVSCGCTSNKGICNNCLNHPTDTLISLNERLRWLERTNDHITMICQSCVGRGQIVDCVSLDCPILYRRCQARRDLTQRTLLEKIIQTGGTLDF